MKMSKTWFASDALTLHASFVTQQIHLFARDAPQASTSMMVNAKAAALMAGRPTTMEQLVFFSLSMILESFLSPSSSSPSFAA